MRMAFRLPSMRSGVARRLTSRARRARLTGMRQAKLQPASWPSSNTTTACRRSWKPAASGFRSPAWCGVGASADGRRLVPRLVPRLDVRLGQPLDLWPFVTRLDRFKVEVRGGRVFVDNTDITQGAPRPHTGHQVQSGSVQLPALSLGKPGPQALLPMRFNCADEATSPASTATV